MYRAFPIVMLIGAALLAAPPAEAGERGHGAAPGWSGRQGHAVSWWSQRDRPGDNRCDAFWNASRDDCHERWREQASRVRQGHGYDYGYGHGRRHHDGRYVDQHSGPRGADVWPGAYGRPDLVYPASGPATGASHVFGARNPQRMRWCAHQYRSYDPASGYYRAYSGRLIYCG